MHRLSISLWLAVALLLCGGPLRAEDYRLGAQVIPDDCKGEASFFDLVKWPSEPKGFKEKDAPHWDIAKLSPYIAPEGIDFTDVNQVWEGHIARDKILGQLKARHGPAFSTLAHLSSLYSIPYKQYCKLNFEKTDDGAVVVDMAGGYRVTFRRAGTQPLITRCEYLKVEGE